MTLRAGATHRDPPPSIPTLGTVATIKAGAGRDWTTVCPPDGNALGNDTAGCCVEAADSRLIECILASAAGADGWKPTTDLVLARYTKLTGFNAADPATDRGTETDADLIDFCVNGIALWEVQRVIVPWWVRVDPHDPDHINTALAVAPLPTTLMLPNGWEAIEADPLAWTRMPPVWTAQEGHRVLLVAPGVVRSWGLDIAVSAAWWARAVVAVDLVAPSDLFDASGLTADGFDRAGMLAAMAGVAV